MCRDTVSTAMDLCELDFIKIFFTLVKKREREQQQQLLARERGRDNDT